MLDWASRGLRDYRRRLGEEEKRFQDCGRREGTWLLAEAASLNDSRNHCHIQQAGRFGQANAVATHRQHMYWRTKTETYRHTEIQYSHWWL